MTSSTQNFSLAIFCDFDGTFAIEDVGSTLARKHLSKRRSLLWEKLIMGDLDPWRYASELFGGFEFSEAETDKFLESVSLDPGAQDLLRWCKVREVPFRILSDGFDRNLDKIQQHQQVFFDYDANHLEFLEDRWHVTPGYPDVSCGCGTGVCKKSRIQKFIVENPEVRTVHIGNGRVSDLCASLFVDYVFAKQTLAEELEERNHRFIKFDTLFDVIDSLDKIVRSRT